MNSNKVHSPPVSTIEPTPFDNRNSYQATRPKSSASLLGRCTDRLLTVAMLSCFLIGGWLLLPQPQTKAHSTTAAQGNDKAASSSMVLDTTSIEEIRLGERVVARNPLRHEASAPSKITPDTWREIRLSMIQNGVEYQLAFLRNLTWINSVSAAPGAMIHLHLEEMGLNGPALVEAICDCPPIEPDDGSGRMVVTGTMRHLAENILDLHVTGLDEPIGVTNTHPIWSEDRQTFVLAGQLRPGENLRSESGVTSQVTRITPHRGPPELTYNLEVDGEHVYQVAATGIFTHNDCLKYANNVLRRRPDGVVMRVDPVGGRTVNLPGFDNSTPNFHHYFHLENGVIRDSVFRRGISVDDYMKKLKELNPQVIDFMFTPKL